jgi:hypothetical protein
LDIKDDVKVVLFGNIYYKIELHYCDTLLLGFPIGGIVGWCHQVEWRGGIVDFLGMECKAAQENQNERKHQFYRVSNYHD